LFKCFLRAFIRCSTVSLRVLFIFAKLLKRFAVFSGVDLYVWMRHIICVML